MNYFYAFCIFFWKVGPAINRDMKPGRRKTRLGETTLKNELPLPTVAHETHTEHSHVALTDKRATPVHPGEQVNLCATHSLVCCWICRLKQKVITFLSFRSHRAHTGNSIKHSLIRASHCWAEIIYRWTYIFQALSITSAICFGASEPPAWADCAAKLQERVSAGLLWHSGSRQIKHNPTEHCLQFGLSLAPPLKTLYSEAVAPSPG